MEKQSFLAREGTRGELVTVSRVIGSIENRIRIFDIYRVEIAGLQFASTSACGGWCWCQLQG